MVGRSFPVLPPRPWRPLTFPFSGPRRWGTSAGAVGRAPPAMPTLGRPHGRRHAAAVNDGAAGVVRSPGRTAWTATAGPPLSASRGVWHAVASAPRGRLGVLASPLSLAPVAGLRSVLSRPGGSGRAVGWIASPQRLRTEALPGVWSPFAGFLWGSVCSGPLPIFHWAVSLSVVLGCQNSSYVLGSRLSGGMICKRFLLFCDWMVSSEAQVLKFDEV